MKINRLYWSDELVGFSNFLYKKYNVVFPPILVGIGSHKFCYLLKPQKKKEKKKRRGGLSYLIRHIVFGSRGGLGDKIQVSNYLFLNLFVGFPFLSQK